MQRSDCHDLWNKDKLNEVVNKQSMSEYKLNKVVVLTKGVRSSEMVRSMEYRCWWKSNTAVEVFKRMTWKHKNWRGGGR